MTETETAVELINFIDEDDKDIKVIIYNCMEMIAI